MKRTSYFLTSVRAGFNPVSGLMCYSQLSLSLTKLLLHSWTVFGQYSDSIYYTCLGRFRHFSPIFARGTSVQSFRTRPRQVTAIFPNSARGRRYGHRPGHHCPISPWRNHLRL